MIISLTSFPARIPYIAPALESIVRQVSENDRIVLWLGDKQFPNRLADIPPRIAAFSNERGGRVEFLFTEDIRSYTKLVPALKTFPKETIITLDDDTVYPIGTISRLKEAREAYPGCVLANCVSDLYRVRGTWRRTSGCVGLRYGPPFLRICTGLGGVLYPPQSLDALVTDMTVARKLAPTADDLWFWFCATRRGTPVVCVPDAVTRLSSIAEATMTDALSAINEVNGDKVNLLQLRNLLDYDPSVEKKLLSVYRANWRMILFSRVLRLLVRYPQQVIYCLRAGGVRFLWHEVRRKLRI